MYNFNIKQVQKSKSLTNELADTLRAEILSGKLNLGEKLPSSKFIEENAGVSRSVVREAVAQLKAEGLVESKHGVGVFVTSKTPKQAFVIQDKEFESIIDSIQILELRMPVECEIAARAAASRTDAQMKKINECMKKMEETIAHGVESANDDLNFHLAIAEATENPYFSRFIKYIGNGMVPSRMLVTINTSEAEIDAFYTVIQEEHRQIAKAIENESPEMAGASMKAHLSASIKRHKQAAEKMSAAKSQS